MTPLITLDMETFYDKDYSLAKMTTEEYCNDPRFQIIGVSTKVGNEPAKWVSFDDNVRYSIHLAHLNDAMVLCHNTAFDAAILSWRLGIRPKFLLDTLSMARAVVGQTKPHSLAKLAEQYGLGAKGTEVLNAMGKRLEDFTPAELAAYGRYCENDVELTHKLFKAMAKGYPMDELRMIDLTLRMYTQPELTLNKQTIQREIDLEEARKARLMASLGGFTTAEDLRSNDKFAEVLRGLGVEPPTKVSAKKSEKAGHEVRTWAFAKSDADFKALMEHDDPMVVAAVEARLGHKSTQKSTRAQRFMGIATRMGRLPVALGYYNAHTGRYGAWDKQNLQNLPAARGSSDPDVALLRKSIEAPPGHKIVVADLSQIEARLLVWQAGQDDKVEAFTQRRDVYSEQASVIYSRKVDRKKNKDDAMPGHVGKATVLGCLGPDTRVFTSNGIKPIIYVNDTDMVWDGVEWVNHSGVVPKGEKEVALAHGLTATLDHEILTEHGWVEWSEVQASPSLFKSAIKSASSPCSTGYASSRRMEKTRGGILSFGVRAVRRALFTVRTFLKAQLHGVEAAVEKPPKLRARNGGGTPTSSQTTGFDRLCSTESLHVSTDVATRTTNSGPGTAGGGLRCTNRGVQTAENSSGTSQHCPDMATSPWRSTASTILADMNRVICGLLRGSRIWLTAGQSAQCRRNSTRSAQRSQTYDIALAGPRNRFTVLTDAGPIIVHNCGYGLGHPKFGGMMRVGMLGGPGVTFDEAFAEQLHVDVGYYARRLAGDDDLKKRVEAVKPLGVGDSLWTTHMACADHIIRVYRADNPRVVNYWKVANEAIIAMYRGEAFEFGGPGCNLLRTEQGAIVLPNGMRLLYPEMEYKDKQFSCLRKKEGRVQRVKMYGGGIVENITQALARIVIGESMLKADRHGYRVALQVHDEIVVVVPDAAAEQAYQDIIGWMRVPPPWAQGVPLDAEGGIADRYGDAK